MSQPVVHIVVRNALPRIADQSIRDAAMPGFVHWLGYPSGVGIEIRSIDNGRYKEMCASLRKLVDNMKHSFPDYVEVYDTLKEILNAADSE